MKSPEDRIKDAEERIDFYYGTHEHNCAQCLEETLNDLHHILVHDEDEVAAPEKVDKAN